MYKACIFDLDGTLANTLSSIAYFANNALLHFGYREIETEAYKKLVGGGAADLVRKMLKICGNTSEDAFLKVSKYYNLTYNQDFLYKAEAYEGIKELLAVLKQEGIKLAVLSNKPHEITVNVANALFGEGYFDFCYGQREDVPKKPNPSSLLSIIEEMDLIPKQCLYIGDTAVDMETGNNANVFTIGVLWGFRDIVELKEHNASLIVKNPIEIFEYIKKTALSTN